jgi:hypothetical protein
VRHLSLLLPVSRPSILLSQCPLLHHAFLEPTQSRRPPDNTIRGNAKSELTRFDSITSGSMHYTTSTRVDTLVLICRQRSRHSVIELHEVGVVAAVGLGEELRIHTLSAVLTYARDPLREGQAPTSSSMPVWRIVDDFAQSKSVPRFARALHPRRVPLHSRNCCHATPRTTPPLRFPLACRCGPSAPSLLADPSSLPCARQVPSPPVPVCESDQERSHLPESCDPWPATGSVDTTFSLRPPISHN